jgi:hypothetical protein
VVLTYLVRYARFLAKDWHVLRRNGRMPAKGFVETLRTLTGMACATNTTWLRETPLYLHTGKVEQVLQCYVSVVLFEIQNATLFQCFRADFSNANIHRLSASSAFVIRRFLASTQIFLSLLNVVLVTHVHIIFLVTGLNKYEPGAVIGNLPHLW